MPTRPISQPAYVDCDGRPPNPDCDAEIEATVHESQDNVRCGAPAPEGWWSCSRRRHHTGQHIAAHGQSETWGRLGQILARWGWVERRSI